MTITRDIRASVRAGEEYLLRLCPRAHIEVYARGYRAGIAGVAGYYTGFLLPVYLAGFRRGALVAAEMVAGDKRAVGAFLARCSEFARAMDAFRAWEGEHAHV